MTTINCARLTWHVLLLLPATVLLLLLALMCLELECACTLHLVLAASCNCQRKAQGARLALTCWLDCCANVAAALLPLPLRLLLLLLMLAFPALVPCYSCVLVPIRCCRRGSAPHLLVYKTDEKRSLPHEKKTIVALNAAAPCTRRPNVLWFR